MAIMGRNAPEINIKWMFALSLLFHLLFFMTLSYSRIFSKFGSSPRIYMPLSAIHVNIVGVAKEGPQEMPIVEKVVPARKSEIRSQKLEVRSQKSEVRSQKPEAKSQKVVQKEKVAIPEPAVREKAVGSSEQAAGKEKLGQQNQETMHSTENKDRPSSLSDQQVPGVQEARVTSGGAVVSGPVVDTPDFKYDYYLGVIRNKIDSRWSQPIAYTQTRQTLIEFTIHRNGEIDNIRVSESSGDYYFDQTALRAVSLANPFPPLPRGYKENFLKVRYRFIFGGKG